MYCQRGQFLNRFVVALLFSLQVIPADITATVANRETFSDRNGTIKFNHLVVDNVRGWVFIGAENRLYKLYPNLTLSESIFDNEKCLDGICPSEIVHNPNKILALDYESSRLISCHSRQGSCVFYKIEDLSDKISPSFEPVTVSNPNVSTVAFVAPGPSTRSNDEKNPLVLYVGVTYGKDVVVPAVSTRSLEEKKLLRIFKSDPAISTYGTLISFNNIYREKYIVNYVYGFSSGSYSYFLTTQMESVNSSSYISKLIRICQQDENYNSYTEIPIKCTDRNGKDYNLVQAAFVTKPSFNLAESLGITKQDDVLFGVFSRSKDSLESQSNKASDESALCVYSLKAINDKFIENIRNCYDGKGDRGLEYIHIVKGKCSKKPVARNFCGITLNSPFGGNLPVQATAVTTFDTHLTAVTAVSKSNFTLVITGTYTGRLIQIAVKNINAALKFNDIALNEESPVNSDLHFDLEKRHLYVMTDHELTRINARDLLPSVSYINTDKGPREGEIKVTFRIENFDNLFKVNHPEIKVAGMPCILSNEQALNSSKEIVCVTKNSLNASKVHNGLIEIFVDGICVAGGSLSTYVEAKIFNVSLRVLTSNSTELIIEGDHLNSGNSISVMVGNISCPVFFHNSNIILCSINLSVSKLNGNVTVKIDRSTITFDSKFNVV